MGLSVRAIAAASVLMGVLGGCESSVRYSHVSDGSSTAAGGAGGAIIGSGGRSGGGGSGGAIIGSGGNGAGGQGTGGAGTGGQGTGGAGTGGVGTGGVGTGGVGTGGVGTGGVGTGGVGTGGVGTGGVGTGGVGTGGQGGMPPTIISIDFVGGVGGAGGMGGAVAIVMTATERAGAKLAANWNSATSFMGSLPALKTADGTATAVGAAWSSPPTGTNPGVWRVGYPDMAGNARMMNGYLDPTMPAMPATVMVTGLPSTFTTRGYDVYVYMTGDVSGTDSRTYGYSITGSTTTFTVTQTGATTDLTAFPGFTAVPAPSGTGNYIVFRNLTTPAFTLTATPGTPSGRQRAPVNGLQIVAPSGS